MKNFGKLGFKNYFDSYDDPSVWNSQRLTVQLDNLLQVLSKSGGFITEGKFKPYDAIILDESESLLDDVDGKTMEKKEIEIFDSPTAISFGAPISLSRFRLRARFRGWRVSSVTTVTHFWILKR